jgi:hypothetical protein
MDRWPDGVWGSGGLGGGMGVSKSGSGRGRGGEGGGGPGGGDNWPGRRRTMGGWVPGSLGAAARVGSSVFTRATAGGATAHGPQPRVSGSSQSG